VLAGRYDLGREIGRGGMGAVWLGRDTVLGRDVALKRLGLLPGVSAPDLERAEREARLAARLNHPHVVAVFDLVDEGDGHWLVMEYVEGVTLATLVKTDGALGVDESAGLIRQAADALAAAHEAGIVHRDVKPSNMLVTPAGDVKITDFGIARAEADASLTQTGLVTGSPAYLAPEVASGSTATEASDVWSLGATLFHLLAGHPPYDVTDNLMGALYRIVHEEPPRLADPGWIDPVLRHTMARRPEDRWTMTEVRDFLAQGNDVRVHPTPVGGVDDHGTRVLQATPSEAVAVPPVAIDPPLVAAAPSPPSPAPARRRRSPWPWVAAAAVVVALLVIGYAALTAGDRGQPSTGGSKGTGSPSSGSTHSSGPGSADQATAMETFLTHYLATVTSDRHAAWDMLTPAYQEASGGFGSYSGFWAPIASAVPSNVRADPAAMTVTYDVAYERHNGARNTEHHTLQLVRDGSSFLINDQVS
jgi:eukaryotic-like serine/threonine-protein kinase